MKRDMDLMRQILIKVEEHDDLIYYGTPDIEGYEEKMVKKHVQLLEDAGFIKPNSCSYADNEIQFTAISISNEGYSFLEEIREPKRWNKFKAWSLTTGATFAITGFKEYMLAKMRGDI